MIENFEHYLLNNLPKSDSFHPTFEQALHQMLQAGGKRFRPMLLLSVVKAKNPLLLKNSYSVALAIEFLHTYSLIHDDLPAMDNASLRRGKPTLHTSFDEVTAILVGDALNTHAFNILANSPLSAETKIELIKILSSDGGINGMIIGQAIDCFFENKKLELSQIKFLHIHKTAKLIAASLKMGAVICGLSNDKIEHLYQFGIDLGLLFQIQDDVLDVISSDESEGKTTHNDESKNSFVTILGLDEAIAAADKLVESCEKALSQMDQQISTELTKLLKRYFNRHKSWAKHTQNILTKNAKFYKIWHSIFMSAKNH